MCIGCVIYKRVLPRWSATSHMSKSDSQEKTLRWALLVSHVCTETTINLSACEFMKLEYNVKSWNLWSLSVMWSLGKLGACDPGKTLYSILCRLSVYAQVYTLIIHKRLQQSWCWAEDVGLRLSQKECRLWLLSQNAIVQNRCFMLLNWYRLHSTYQSHGHPQKTKHVRSSSALAAMITCASKAHQHCRHCPNGYIMENL